MEQLAVLYDDDCGFCKVLLSGLLAWDRAHRLRPVPIESLEGDRLLAGMESERRLASWHVVEPESAPLSAGAAFPALLRLLPGGRALAWATERAPGATDRAYRAVAACRSTIGPRLPAALRRRADRLVSSRNRDG